MSANPPAKRRRHDTPSSTLSKPFKSPLRKPPSQPTPSPEKPTTPSSSTSNPPSAKEPKETKNETASSNTTNNQPTTPPPKPTVPTTTPQFRKPITDPAFQSLQKTHRTLQSRLSSLRSDLDTLTQARRIETSSKDTELEGLVAKWRAVAQDAAEEVFGGARERVGRMGGMRGYKQRARSQVVEARRWEVEEKEGWFGGQVGSDEQDALNGENKGEEAREEEEEEFTMEVMLKTLNIDPKIIGFDLAGQQWVK